MFGRTLSMTEDTHISTLSPGPDQEDLGISNGNRGSLEFRDSCLSSDSISLDHFSTLEHVNRISGLWSYRNSLYTESQTSSFDPSTEENTYSNPRYPGPDQEDLGISNENRASIERRDSPLPRNEVSLDQHSPSEHANHVAEGGVNSYVESQTSCHGPDSLLLPTLSLPERARLHDKGAHNAFNLHVRIDATKRQVTHLRLMSIRLRRAGF
ncbi:hypothetical protein J132_09348 [Termitomyces sp. J132]|nr:hypothetical protein H2248_002798 [Termitomyces sp. 'cryptogamus']KNZ76604.1 hypothetical protein J132_09348 [Termitomyces sp. J132]